MFIFIDLWLQAYSEGDFETLISGFNMESIEMFMNVDKTYFLFQAILYAASLTGVYFMWNLKKTGFHLYTVAQVLVLILQQIYFPSLPFPFLPFIITLTFVLLYFTNLKHME